MALCRGQVSLGSQEVIPSETSANGSDAFNAVEFSVKTIILKVKYTVNSFNLCLIL